MRSNLPVIAAVAGIAIATLLPIETQELPLRACLICGERGVADALLNILLFQPFGASLAARNTSARAATLFGLVLSLLVELLQLLVPGRDPSLGDLVFNSVGACTGHGAYTTLRRLRSVSCAHAERIAALCAAVALLVLAAGAVLLAPAFPKQSYYGQWTPEFTNAERYAGRVLNAQVGAMAVHDGRVRDSESLRTALLRGDALQLHVLAGAPPSRGAPVFNIYDEHEREVLSVVAERADILVRYRVLGTTLRLDQPVLRFREVLRTVGDGETWSLRMWLVPGGVCIRVEQARACPAGYSAARGWALLMHTDMPAWLERLLDHFWAAALFVPAGLFAWRRRTLQLLFPFALLGLLAISRFTALLAMPASVITVALGGLLAGALCGRRWRRDLV